MASLREYKVFKTTKWSSRGAVNEYSMLVTHCLTAEPDARKCVELSNETDSYVIAENITEAIEMLSKKVDPYFKGKRKE